MHTLQLCLIHDRELTCELYLNFRHSDNFPQTRNQTLPPFRYSERDWTALWLMIKLINLRTSGKIMQSSRVFVTQHYYIVATE